MKWLKRCFGLLFILVMVAGCGPRSLDDFQEEGEGVIRSLIQELQAIHTREQLLAASGKLQRHFDRLVSIVIAAEEFNLAHPEIEKGELERHNHELSDRLRIELNRLYRLEGGRQIIEKCQEKALHRLDAFEKKHAKN
jgi:hypothetical protein